VLQKKKEIEESKDHIQEVHNNRLMTLLRNRIIDQKIKLAKMKNLIKNHIFHFNFT